MSIRPTEDRILIRPHTPETETPAGLVIVRTQDETPTTGEVIAVGPGRWESGHLIPLDVYAGDTVLIAKYGGTAVQVDGEELRIYSARDVLAVV